jgi:hypothetical protein
MKTKEKFVDDLSAWNRGKNKQNREFPNIYKNATNLTPIDGSKLHRSNDSALTESSEEKDIFM